MEIVIIYVAFGILATLFVSMVIDIAEQNKQEKLERELVRTILKNVDK